MKLLVITLSNIGDVVMTTPVIVALRQQYPDARIDIVTDARAAELFEHMSGRDTLFLKDKQAGWRGTARLVKQLRLRRYDLVVDLRTDGLTLLLRARNRLTRRGSRPRGQHAVQRHFGVIAAYEGLRDIPATTLWLAQSEHNYATSRLSGLPGQCWLALGPGARWAPKRWPVESFCALVERLQSRFDAVVLLGSADDSAACRELADSLALPCLNLAGETTLLQAAAVLQRCGLFIGNDSGLGHIAAARNTPTLTLFGPGEQLRYHPWHERARWLQSDSGDITDVTVDAVVAEAARILENS
jgi:ADP-heptose:LPS heptosyltransferase